MSEIKALIQQRGDLNMGIQSAIRTRFPIGSPIHWRTGLSKQTGTVMDHGYGERLLVKNKRTDKTYWIDFSSVFE